QPMVGSQSMVQGLWSSQFGGSPGTQMLFWHFSAPLHLLPSLHWRSVVQLRRHWPGPPLAMSPKQWGSPATHLPGQAASPLAALTSHCSPTLNVPSPHTPPRITCACFPIETRAAIARPSSSPPGLTPILPVGTRRYALTVAPGPTFAAGPVTLIWRSPDARSLFCEGATVELPPALKRPWTFTMTGLSAKSFAFVPICTA